MCSRFTFFVVAFAMLIGGFAQATRGSLKPALEETASCSTTTVEEGDTASLTCHVSQQTSHDNDNLQVYFAGSNESNVGSIIIECFQPIHEPYQCKSENPLYRHQTSSTTTRYGTILFTANQTTEGYYYCMILNSNGSADSQRCNVTLKRKVSTNSPQVNEKASVSLEIVLGIAAVALLAVITAITVLLYRKCRRGESRNDLDRCLQNRQGSREQRRKVRGSCCCLLSRSEHPAGERKQMDTLIPEAAAAETALQKTPARHYWDSGIASLAYPSSIEQIFSDPTQVDQRSETSEPAALETPLTLSTVIRNIGPIVMEMARLRMELQTRTPPLPAQQSEQDSDSQGACNTEKICHKIDSFRPDTPQRAAITISSTQDHDSSSAMNSLSPFGPNEWPPVHDVLGQKAWIDQRLIPYLGSTDFPRNSQDANKQLTDLLDVIQSIECRLADLRNQKLRQTTEESTRSMESLLFKLENTHRLAKKRQEALNELLTNLVRIDHHVQNAIAKMNLSMESVTK